VAVTACGSEVSPAASPRAALTATPAPAPMAPTGGEIRIVEQGLSPMWDGNEKEMVTYGIIVENTSRDWAAVKTQATIRVTDSGGKPLTDLTGRTSTVIREIGVILPGQRVGIGADTHVDRPGAVSILVEIGESTWLPPDNELIRVAKVTAGGVKTVRQDTGSAVSLGFTVDSEYPTILEKPSAQAIFRDSAGRIVGGTAPGRTNPADRYGPGRSTGRIDATYGRPATTDDTQTEVYISPF
jgi:hypothetical protein